MPPDLTNPVELAALVASILDRLGLRYAVGGAVASTLLGEPRTTLDLDVLIEVVPASLPALADELEAADFYVPRGAASAAVETPRSFNVVHRPSAIKVDFFVAGRTALDHDELDRRRAVAIAGGSGATIHVAAAEDLVAQKLLWFQDGGKTSDRQWRDVLGLLKVQSTHIDKTLLAQCAVRLGVEDLLTQALRETATT